MDYYFQLALICLVPCLGLHAYVVSLHLPAGAASDVSMSPSIDMHLCSLLALCVVPNV
jgi:hypothetical protein